MPFHVKIWYDGRQRVIRLPQRNSPEMIGTMSDNYFVLTNGVNGMKGIFWSIIAAFAAGVCGATQGAVNAMLGKNTGQYAMVVGISLAQAAMAALLMLRGGGGSFAGLLSPWLILAGALGVGIILGLSVSISSLGAVSVFVLVFAGQLVASTVIDYFGLFGVPRITVNPYKIVSILVILFGVYMLLKSA